MKSIFHPLSAIIALVAVTMATAGPLYFPLIQMTGSTNDATINVQAVNNPVIFNGNFYWLPTGGTNITTTNGIGYLTLIPGKYNAYILGQAQSWQLNVTNNTTLVNAANLTGGVTYYSGVQNLTGSGGINVTSTFPGNVVVDGGALTANASNNVVTGVWASPGGSPLTNGQTGNVQFTNSTVTVSNLLALGTITGASLSPSTQSSGQLNINLGSGTLSGSSVNVGNLSGNGAGLTGIPYSSLTGTPSIPSTNGLATTNYVNAATANLVTIPALGGTNDDTAIFNTYFNSRLPVLCPAGDFNVSHVLITNDNETISGYGCRLHMLTNIQGYAVCTRGMTNVSIAGLSVYGGIHQTPGWTFTNNIIPWGNMSEYGWISVPSGNQTPTNARSGFYLAMYGWGNYKDLVADGFNVAGFYLSNTNTQYGHQTPIAKFSNPVADWCYVGIELPGSLHVVDFTTNNTYLYFDGTGQIPNWGDPQYTVVSSPVVHNSSIGITEAAWNVAINNPQISDTFIGVFIPGNVHGSITGGNLNHNSGVSYYMSGVSAGEEITGQQLRGGDGLYICGGNAGVTFNGCMFDAASILVVTNNTGATVFNGCSWQDAFAFTLDNTGIGVVTNGCYSELTLTNQGQMTWVGRHVGDGSGITNLAAASLTGTLPQSTLPGAVVTNNATQFTSTTNSFYVQCNPAANVQLWVGTNAYPIGTPLMIISNNTTSFGTGVAFANTSVPGGITASAIYVNGQLIAGGTLVLKTGAHGGNQLIGDGNGGVRLSAGDATYTTTNNFYLPGSLVATNGLVLPTNGVPPAPNPAAGWLWNSNNALFWVTQTHTNYISGP